ncbi:MAG: hypothetical protein ACYTFI_22785 [Planctomycetota bacterium]
MAYGPLPDLADGEQVLLELVPTNEESYLRNRNCVGLITDRNLYYIKKKILGQYWELVRISLDRVDGISHGRRFAVGAMLGGAVLVAISAAFLYYLLTGQEKGSGVFTIPTVLGLGGGSLAFGVKRRVIRFHTADATFVWTSPAMRFRATGHLADSVDEIFSKRGVKTS